MGHCGGIHYGFKLMLVNPYFIKQMPGRKSDVKTVSRLPAFSKGFAESCFINAVYMIPNRLYSKYILATFYFQTEQYAKDRHH